MERRTSKRPGLDDPAPDSHLLRVERGPKFSPDRTALLVIDPVNDFLSEGGAGWEMTKGTVQKHDVIGNLRRAIEGARARGISVLFGPMAYTEEDYSDEELQRRSGIHRMMFERRMFLAGSWGADFHPELRPLAAEIVLLPHKGIDVFETDLPVHLERLGTTHLVIAGMTANLCCESTGRHATEHGYDVTFLSDAIGAAGIPGYEASIHVNYPLVGNAVMEVDEFLQAVDVGGEPGVLARPGDTVRGSDRGEIGTVQEMVGATVERDGYLLVPRGLIFEKDTFIPLDAVVKRSGTEVFINVPKLVVGKMPWSEPPSASTRRAKLGPRSADVEKLYGSRSPSSRETG
ncbi:MAG: cysteine hydrolase family protein [Gemmatimonadota bacterium]